MWCFNNEFLLLLIQLWLERKATKQIFFVCDNKIPIMFLQWIRKKVCRLINVEMNGKTMIKFYHFKFSIETIFWESAINLISNIRSIEFFIWKCFPESGRIFHSGSSHPMDCEPMNKWKNSKRKLKTITLSFCLKQKLHFVFNITQ